MKKLNFYRGRGTELVPILILRRYAGKFPICLLLFICLSNIFSQLNLPYTIKHPKPAHELSGVHPSFDMEDIRPNGFVPNVGALAFLSDGRLVLSSIQENGGAGINYNTGRMYILSGLGEGPISIKQIDQGMNQPLGVVIVNDTIYAVQAWELLKYGYNEINDIYTRIPIASIPPNYRWVLDLVYKNGVFTTSTGYSDGGTRKGEVYEIRDGVVKAIMDGTRFSNGLGIGPDEEIFIINNQGNWYPANEMSLVKEGRRLSYFSAPSHRPVVIMPEGVAANSPSKPVMMNEGVYKGQMAVGDMRYGNIHRLYLEKIGDSYQGGLIHFSGGVDAGINRIAIGPDGALYLGGAGIEQHWTHNYNQLYSGLQRFKPNGKPVFEMLSASSRANGFVVEFTQKLNPATLNNDVFTVRSWHYDPDFGMSGAYGDGGVLGDEKTLVIENVILSGDQKRVFLQINGLEVAKVVHISHDSTYQSVDGLTPWIYETWYTLNQLGPEFNIDEFTDVSARTYNGNSVIQISKKMNMPVINIHLNEFWSLDIMDAKGKVVYQNSGYGNTTLNLGDGRDGVYIIVVKSHGGTYHKKLIRY